MAPTSTDNSLDANADVLACHGTKGVIGEVTPSHDDHATHRCDSFSCQAGYGLDSLIHAFHKVVLRCLSFHHSTNRSVYCIPKPRSC